MGMHLTNAQRKHLRRLAHAAPALIQLGKNGLTPAFYKNFDVAMNSHELVKLRFTNNKEEREELSTALEAATGVSLVSMVGHTAIYYRPNPDVEKRKIVLPRPGAGTIKAC